MLLTLPDVPLHSTSFALEDRWLLWARLRMYPSRLTLTGWSLTGPHQREIPLNRIAEVDHTDRHLRLDVEGREPVALLVEEPARWANLLRAHRAVQDDL